MQGAGFVPHLISTIFSLSKGVETLKGAMDIQKPLMGFFVY
jgi:hypothetical protein